MAARGGRRAETVSGAILDDVLARVAAIFE
jgi:hypothetical protein